MLVADKPVHVCIVSMPGHESPSSSACHARQNRTAFSVELNPGFWPTSFVKALDILLGPF